MDENEDFNEKDSSFPKTKIKEFPNATWMIHALTVVFKKVKLSITNVFMHVLHENFEALNQFITTDIWQRRVPLISFVRLF